MERPENTFEKYKNEALDFQYLSGELKEEDFKGHPDYENAICNIVKASIEDFEDIICQAIIEVLFIQGASHDRAFTCIYTAADKKSAGEIKKGYLKAISEYTDDFTRTLDIAVLVDPDNHPLKEISASIRKEKTLTILSDLYFGKNLFYSRIEEDNNHNQGHKSQGRKQWYRTGDIIEKTYSPTGVGLSLDKLLEEDDIQRMIESVSEYYAKLIKENCFETCDWLEILLIPIALDSNEEKREKLGMVFLHLGGNGTCPEIEFKDIYRDIVLYWHYKISAEIILEHRKAEEDAKAEKERAIARAGLFDRLEEPLEEITNLLDRINVPVTKIKKEMSPDSQFLFAGRLVETFFEIKNEKTINLAPDIDIQSRHAFDDFEGNEDAKKFIAAVLLKALGEETELRGRDPWDYLVSSLKLPPKSKERLATGILKSLPQDILDTPSNDVLEPAFNKIKAWYSDAYKPSGNLSSHLLELISNVLSIGISGTDGTYTISIASKLPVDTIQGIYFIHRQYTVKQLCLDASDNVITLKLKEPLTIKNPQNLLKSFKQYLQTRRYESDVPRGDTTPILYYFFSKAKVEDREKSASGTENNGEKNSNNEINLSGGKKITLCSENGCASFSYEGGEPELFKLIFNEDVGSKITINTSITRRDHAPD